MTLQVLTPWFPPEVEPTREGDYLARVSEDSNPTLCTWTGTEWKYSNGTTTIYQKREWCGLSFDPQAAPKGKSMAEVQAWAHGWWAAMAAMRGEA